MKAKFKRIVDAGDLEGTRISLTNEMMLDPRGESFIEMRRYAESSFHNLYDNHDGTTLDTDQNKWDEALLFATKNALDNNFSKERLDFYYNIAKVVLKEKADRLRIEEESKMSYSERDFADRMASDKFHNKKKIYFGISVGSLLLGGIGVIVGKPLIASIGLAGAAIAGGLMYKENRR